MKILKNTYLQNYREKTLDVFQNFDMKNLENKETDFDYVFWASSVFSAKIEWNTLDLNSFMNAKEFSKSSSKEVQEIDDLLSAYIFVKDSVLNEENFLKSHDIASKTLLIQSKRGKYRKESVWVFWKDGLVYMAVEHEYVGEEMSKLFNDIQELIGKDLCLEEIFYYASMIHLVFVHIHPFMDSNGRVARLLEKWFLQEKLWEAVWNISSEEYYWDNRAEYYKNIDLWIDYYNLNYDKSIDFLCMLVHNLRK